VIYEKKTTKNFEKNRNLKLYWPKLCKKRLVRVKNRIQINGLILNNVVFIRRL